jgi:hypothetical protein
VRQIDGENGYDFAIIHLPESRSRSISARSRGSSGGINTVLRSTRRGFEAS